MGRYDITEIEEVVVNRKTSKEYDKVTIACGTEGILKEREKESFEDTRW